MKWHLEFCPIRDLCHQNHRLPLALRSAHPKRQNHYLNGRLAMQCALHVFGRVTWVTSKANGSLAMPEGFSGSISHSEQFVAAVVARAQDHQELGVDCEEWILSEVAQDVWRHILTPNERCFKGHLSLVFSAKESIYKAYSNKLGFFDFGDVEITAIDKNVFQYRLVNHDICGLGYFSSGLHHIITVVATGSIWTY